MKGRKNNMLVYLFCMKGLCVIVQHLNLKLCVIYSLGMFLLFFRWGGGRITNFQQKGIISSCSYLSTFFLIGLAFLTKHVALNYLLLVYHAFNR